MSSPPPAPGRLGRLADFAFRRRRAVLVAWIAGLVAAFAATALAGDFSADYSTPGSESRAGGRAAEGALPAAEPRHRRRRLAGALGCRRAGRRARIDRLVAQSRGLEGIGGTAGAAQISRDGTIGVLRIGLDELPGAVPDSTGKTMIDLAQRASGDGLRVELDGQVIANAQQGAISSEAIGIMIAALVLLLTFGSLVAAGLPLATALFGLGISSAVVGLLAAVTAVPDWAPALASMLGIGVGIDYALLIVTRYRGALAAGLDVRAALGEAVSTAGRSVLIAGTMVVISLLGLFLMDLPYLYGAALSAIAAVLIVMAASITLVPALLAMPGGGSTACTSRARTAPLRIRRPRSRRAGAARCSGARGSPRSPARPSCWRSPRRSPGCARLPRPRQRRARHHDAPGLRARLARLRPGRQRAAAAGLADLRPRGDDGAGREAAQRAGRRLGERAGRQPARRRGRADRRAAHVAAGPGDRGPDRPPARRRAARRRRAGRARRRDRRVHGPEPRDRAAAAAVRRRCGHARLPAAARELPLGHRRREGGADEPALDRRRVRRGGATWPRAAGPASSSASTRRRRCRRSSR